MSSSPSKKQKKISAIFDAKQDTDELLVLEERSSVRPRIQHGKRIHENYLLRGHELGHGATATVVLCRNLESGEEFACKKIFKDSRDFFCSVHSEVDVMTHLSASASGYSTAYLIMDLCARGDLHNFLRGKKRSEVLVAWITKCLMSAIKHCHDMGVVHRDVKPENVLFTVAGKLKLADFRLATRIPPDGQLITGVVGTMKYVAPEVLLVDDYTEKVDTCSDGIILHYLLVGTVPYTADSLEEMAEALDTVDLDLNDWRWKSISMLARDRVAKMLAKDASKRLSATGSATTPLDIISDGASPMRNPTTQEVDNALPHPLALLSKGVDCLMQCTTISAGHSDVKVITDDNAADKDNGHDATNSSKRL